MVEKDNSLEILIGKNSKKIEVTKECKLLKKEQRISIFVFCKTVNGWLFITYDFFLFSDGKCIMEGEWLSLSDDKNRPSLSTNIYWYFHGCGFLNLLWVHSNFLNPIHSTYKYASALIIPCEYDQMFWKQKKTLFIEREHKVYTIYRCIQNRI